MKAGELHRPNSLLCFSHASSTMIKINNKMNEIMNSICHYRGETRATQQHSNITIISFLC